MANKPDICVPTNSHYSVKIVNLLLALFYGAIINAQNSIAFPDIINFSQAITKTGSQTWQVTEDHSGILYFANNAGLVTYNGREWKLFRVPNKTIVKSLLPADNGKIYVGAQGEIGYFAPNRWGNLVYTSLVNYIDSSERYFGDVWKIILQDQQLFFRTYRKIYQINLSTKRVTIYTTPQNAKWSFLEMIDNQIFAYNEEQGMVAFKNGRWTPLSYQLPKETIPTSLLAFGKDSLLLTTLRDGIFAITGGHVRKLPIPPAVQSTQIYTALKTDEESFAVGTVSAGIFLLQRSGKLIRHLSMENGLQNNNVLSLYKDSHQGLWAGLDDGIDLINYAAPLQLINPAPKTRLAGYTAGIFKHNLYIGTSDGIYYTPLEQAGVQDISFLQGQFKKLANTSGQVWNISILDNLLLTGTNDGAFIIDHNVMKPLEHHLGGTWLYRTVSGSKIISGTYSGIQLYNRKNNTLVPGRMADNSLRESLRFIELDTASHVVWASHPYRGIYRIQMTSGYDQELSVDWLTSKQGLPTNNNNFVFKIGGKIVFATEQGIYEWDAQHHRFTKSKTYEPFFGTLSVKFMTEDAKGRIWFATEKNMGVLDEGHIRYIPEMDGQLIAGFEQIYPFDDQNILINSSKGIYHLNFKNYKNTPIATRVSFNKIQAIGVKDSLLFNGYPIPGAAGDNALRLNNEQIKLPAVFNSFHFEFTASDIIYADKIQYSYQLKGFDPDWSAWSVKTEKDYTNLPYGKYTFFIKAKDRWGKETAPIGYSFEILPRWYQTWPAWLLYLLLAGYAVYLLHKIQLSRLQKQKTKYEKEQAQLKYIFELENERSEMKIIQLQKEQLETKVQYKNKELATTTMHLYKRGRLLGKIKEEVTEGIKQISNTTEKKAFNRLIKLIIEEEKRDDDWNQFSIHFDQVHNNFLHKIKMAYPALTPSDMKICAYVKMNLSSKEIAQLLNITLKGVEIARYRLRKRFSLAANQSLSGFIQEFS